MSLKNIVNFILFQLLWLACVWGAAHQLLYPGLAVFSLLLIWHLLPANQHSGDLRVMLLALLMGGIVDSLWQYFDILSYQLSLTDRIAPIWILLLWMGFALTINHSLSWLKGRALIASIFSAAAAPCSYYAAERLGAVEFASANRWVSLSLLALAWAVIFPLLILAARRWAVPDTEKNSNQEVHV